MKNTYSLLSVSACFKILCEILIYKFANENFSNIIQFECVNVNEWNFPFSYTKSCPKIAEKTYRNLPSGMPYVRNFFYLTKKLL